MSLKISKLKARVEEKEILHGVDLVIKPGEIHALMGPNGSGKSTLGNVLMGHPGYEVTGGKVSLAKDDVLEMEPWKRARAGIFLAFQHPISVSGVPLGNFLKAAYDNLYGDHYEDEHRVKKVKPAMAALEFYNRLKELAGELGVPEEFLRKPINEGLSGGERKKIETLQILALQPKYMILDELDTGTDVDTLKLIGTMIGGLKIRKGYKPAPGILMITHYNRIFEYVQPDFVHVIKKGKIVKSGGRELVEAIESGGYERY